MKLISMTDFVLEQEQPTYLEKEEFEDVFYKIHNYANFLKKPLEICMFVPCDENGDILRDGVNWNKKFYQKAQERVLFEGFEVKKNDRWTTFFYKKEFFTSFTSFSYIFKNKTIEDLIDFDVTLTLTALKQLGL
jgi:hypothetical protein